MITLTGNTVLAIILIGASMVFSYIAYWAFSSWKRDFNENKWSYLIIIGLMAALLLFLGLCSEFQLIEVVNN